MSKILSTTVATIALSLGLAAIGSGPALAIGGYVPKRPVVHSAVTLASNYHDYHPWRTQTQEHVGYAGSVDSHGY